MLTKNKMSILLGTAIAGLGFYTTPLMAEQAVYELGAGASYFMFEEDFDVKDNIGFRGLAGYRFSDRWGAELVWDNLSTETEGFPADLKLNQGYLSALYHFRVESALQPYLSLGWGQGEFKVSDLDYSNSSTATNIGAGLKWYMTENWVLRPSVNYFVNTEFDEDHSTVGLTLSYVWGGKPAAKPVVAAAPADSDADGVIDSADSCPATPSTASVDSRGCPLDSDRDGVYDYLDRCADTGAQLKVDKNGCPMTLSETVSIDLQVNFDSNSDVVKPAYFSEIERVAKFLSQYANTSVVIEGHTDTSGAASYNKSLSQRRADAVAKVLVEQFNVAQSRVSAMGYGEERPIADESTREGQLANRRVVAKVSAAVENLQKK